MNMQDLIERDGFRLQLLLLKKERKIKINAPQKEIDNVDHEIRIIASRLKRFITVRDASINYRKGE